MIKILGIDPGTRYTGYAIIDHYNNISCMQEKPMLLKRGYLDLTKLSRTPGKIKRFHSFFQDILDTYEPDIIAIETPFMGRNVKTFQKLSYLRGMIYFIGDECTILEFAPREMKKMIMGSGKASKEEIADFVKAKFDMEDEDVRDDVTDAIALTLCAIITLKE